VKWIISVLESFSKRERTIELSFFYEVFEQTKAPNVFERKLATTPNRAETERHVLLDLSILGYGKTQSQKYVSSNGCFNKRKNFQFSHFFSEQL